MSLVVSSYPAWLSYGIPRYTTAPLMSAAPGMDGACLPEMFQCDETNRESSSVSAAASSPNNRLVANIRERVPLHEPMLTRIQICYEVKRPPRSKYH